MTEQVVLVCLVGPMEPQSAFKRERGQREGDQIWREIEGPGDAMGEDGAALESLK